MRMSYKEAIKRGLLKKEDVKNDSTEKSTSKAGFFKILDTLKCAKVFLSIDSGSLTLISNVIPSSLNKIVNWHGIYWFKYSRCWKDHVRLSILEYGRSNITQEEAWPVVIITRKGRSTHMDYDNVIVKPIIDGFVKGGVIKDDTNEFFKCSPFTIHMSGNENKMELILFNKKSSFIEYINNHLLNQ